MAKNRYIVLPILNRDTSLFRSLELSESTTIKPVEDAHFSRIIHSAPERYQTLLKPKTKCAYVALKDGEEVEKRLRDASILVRFTMNFMCETGPLIFAFGLYAEEIKKFRPLEYFDIPAGAERKDLAAIKYKIRPGSTADTIKKYHSTVEAAVTKHPGAILALNRMNWFLTKDEFEDRIIDLTIGLESLIPGKDELRYRFSLYLAFITEPDPAKRLENFKLFRALYDTRSRIVHGGDHDKQSEKSEEIVREKADDLKRLSLSAINYYLFFLSSNVPANWQQHLQELVLASAPRAVD